MFDRNSDWFRRPELILADLVKSHAIGKSNRIFYRATVLAVDEIGGRLQNEDGNGSYPSLLSNGREGTLKATIGPKNPKGSIKARILTDMRDRMISDDDLGVFWPFFPNDFISSPLSPGEHALITFEDMYNVNGLWLCRVPGHEGQNEFIGINSYDWPITHNQSAMDSFSAYKKNISNDSDASLAPPFDVMSTIFKQNG